MTLGVDEFESKFGKYLYELLPAVYRERDNTARDRAQNVTSLGDLARFLDACGLLLDGLRGSLDQRLADAFPDNTGSGPPCQEWLIPYFARLLDVTLVAPNLRGQRDEVFNAVRWRQGKGALPAVEEISAAVLEADVEVQEGWRRVALTPRVGAPLLPPSVFGVMRTLDARWPSLLARHPGLPAATVDLRCSSRAVQTTVVSPAVKTSRLAGAPYRFRQANHHGVPAGPGSFDDVSRRTVDLRAAPTARVGHAHPRRLLVYAPVPRGLLPPPAVAMTWAEAQTSPRVAFTREPDSRDPSKTELVVRNLSEWPLVITDDVVLPNGADVTHVTLHDLRFVGRVHATRGRLTLERVVATDVAVDTAFFDPDAPVLEAKDSLVGTVTVRAGYSYLESTSVRRDAIFGAVVARNCLFAGALSDGAGHRPSAGNLSYCRVPPELAALPRPPGAADFPLVIDESCTTVAPDFFASGAELPAQPIEPDAAVLSPACPDAIALGADDGGELGGFHHGRLRPVIVEQPQTIAMPGSERTLSDLVFASKLTVSETASPAAGAAPSPPLSLERVAIRELEVNATSANDASGRQLPVLWARSSLFGTLHVTPGLARLEYCTVLVDAAFDHVQASDCVFAGTLSVGGELETEDCLRYSRLPSEVLARGSLGTGANFPACTAERPVFHESDFDRAVAGSAGLGVLHPAAPAEVCFGAEDGGEMGAFHEARVCLSREAVLDKLSEHLPVGVVPVLVPDLRLDIVPPVARDA